MQTSGSGHASSASNELTAGLIASGSGLVVLNDSSRGAEGGGVGSGKAVPPLPKWTTEVVTSTCMEILFLAVTGLSPSSLGAVTCGPSTGATFAVSDVAGLSSIGAALFSMPSGPTPAGSAATQSVRATVPHKAAHTASCRRLFISFPPAPTHWWIIAPPSNLTG